MIEIFFDVETKKLFQEIGGKIPEKLGVSIVSIYRREVKNGAELNGLIQSFWEKEIANTWRLFEEADRIIGFNSLKFDVLALKPYLPQKFLKLNHFDILDNIKDELGRRIPLNALASETLGKKKTDVGINAVKYWVKGDNESLAKLKRYCEADVLLTRDIYDFGMKNKYLKYIDIWNTARRVEVDFSYPEDELNCNKQVGLF